MEGGQNGRENEKKTRRERRWEEREKMSGVDHRTAIDVLPLELEESDFVFLFFFQGKETRI